MKYLVNLFFLIFVITNCCSQNFKKNNCSENLEITFLSKSKGKLFFDEHKSTNDYLNIVIDKSGISYKGNYFKSEDEFENSVLIDSTLQKQTNVIIGVENSSPFFAFTDVICWLKYLNSNLIKEIDEIKVYHFD